MKRSRIGPKTYDAAVIAQNRRVARQTERVARNADSPESRLAPAVARKGRTLNAKVDPKGIAWAEAVKERDGNKCQWPGFSYEMVLSFPVGFTIETRLAISPCATGDTRIDAHHKAKRSQRPDLKYDVDNGISLCRTHHDWTDYHHDEAVKLGLLSTETYELAHKKQ
jgi:hypothetical protein